MLCGMRAACFGPWRCFTLPPSSNPYGILVLAPINKYLSPFNPVICCQALEENQSYCPNSLSCGHWRSFFFPPFCLRCFDLRIFTKSALCGATDISGMVRVVRYARLNKVSERGGCCFCFSPKACNPCLCDASLVQLTFVVFGFLVTLGWAAFATADNTCLTHSHVGQSVHGFGAAVPSPGNLEDGIVLNNQKVWQKRRQNHAKAQSKTKSIGT